MTPGAEKPRNWPRSGRKKGGLGGQRPKKTNKGQRLFLKRGKTENEKKKKKPSCEGTEGILRALDGGLCERERVTAQT